MAKTKVGTLVDAVLDLVKISERAARPELTDEMREELCDTNPPLPSLLMVFAESDSVESCFVTLSREFGNLRCMRELRVFGG